MSKISIHESYRTKLADPDYVDSVVDKILESGWIELPEFFTDEIHASLVKYGESLGFDDKRVNHMSGTPAMNVATSDEMMLFINRIYARRCEITGENVTGLVASQQVVGVPVMNASNIGEENPFHFDASYVNMTYGLKISCPIGEGCLMLYPNFRRRFRLSVISKLLARLIIHVPLIRRIYPPNVVSYTEKALNIFFGDISLHGVSSISQGTRLVLVFNTSRTRDVE